MSGKTLFLHIGAHRTATTYLQQSLHLNRDLLASAGIDTLSDLAIWGQGHHNVAWSHLQWALRDESAAPAQYRCRFAGRVRGSALPSLFLSSEFFERFDAAAVDRLRASLDGCRVVLVYFIRNQPEYLQSLYCEDIKHGVVATFAEWLADAMHDGFGDYHRVLRCWTRGLDTAGLRLVRYDPLRAAGQDPFEYVLREVLAAPAPQERLRRPAPALVNASMDAGLMRLMLEMNRIHGRQEQHDAGVSPEYLAMRQRLERAYEARFGNAGGRAAILLSAQSAAAIEARFAASNALLLREFGASICNPAPDGALFPRWRAPGDVERVSGRTPGDDELMDLLSRVLRAG